MMATKFQIAVSCQLRHLFINYSQRSTFFLLRRLLSCTGIAKTNDSSVQKQRLKGEGPVRALQREGGQTILLFLYCQKVRYRLTCRREVLDGIGCDEFASELGATCGSPLLHQVGDYTLHRDFAAGLLDVDLHVGDKGIVQHQSLEGTLTDTKLCVGVWQHQSQSCTYIRRLVMFFLLNLAGIPWTFYTWCVCLSSLIQHKNLLSLKHTREIE